MSVNPNGMQREAIRRLIRELEIKKCKSIHKDIYENHIGDSEFWQGLTDEITDKLIQNGYHDKFQLKNGGYYIELCDEVNKVKYNIDRYGNIEGPEDYMPPKGCYVATCVYGSYDCPEVWTLRRFRDDILSENIFGRLFIKCYYAVSPTAVKLFGDYKWFHKIFKKPLDRLVEKLNSDGVENTQYYD